MTVKQVKTKIVKPKRPVRRRVAVATAAVVVAGGLAFGINNSFFAGPSGSETCPATAAPHATCYAVPTTIDDTCTTDVTIPLYDWFYSLTPYYGFTDPVDVELSPTACYLIQGQIYLRAFNGFILNGNGATFKRTESIGAETYMDSSCTTTGGDLCLPTRAAVCDQPGAFTNPEANAGEPKVGNVMLEFEGGCQIVVNGIDWIGPNPTGAGGNGGAGCTAANAPNEQAWDGKCQQDTFLSFNGAENSIAFNNTMDGPDGDYIDAGGLHEALGTGGGAPARNITEINNTLSHAGRDGFSAEQVNAVTIEDNNIGGAADGLIDMEDDTPVVDCTPTDECFGSVNVDMSENNITTGAYPYVVSGITDAPITNFEFSGNVFTGGGYLRIDIQDVAGKNCGLSGPVGCGGNIDIAANTATSPDVRNTGNGYFAAVVLNGVTNVYVHNNTDAVQAPVVTFVSASAQTQYNGQPPPPVTNAGNTWFNTLSTGATVSNSGGTTTCGNVTTANTAIDGACSTGTPGTLPTPPTIAVLPTVYYVGEG